MALEGRIGMEYDNSAFRTRHVARVRLLFQHTRNEGAWVRMRVEAGQFSCSLKIYVDYKNNFSLFLVYKKPSCLIESHHYTVNSATRVLPEFWTFRFPSNERLGREREAIR